MGGDTGDCRDRTARDNSPRTSPRPAVLTRVGSRLAVRDDKLLVHTRRRTLAFHAIDRGERRRRCRQAVNERRQRTGFSFDIDEEMRPTILNKAAQVERCCERVNKRAKPDSLDQAGDIDQSAFDHGASGADVRTIRAPDRVSNLASVNRSGSSGLPRGY